MRQTEGKPLSDLMREHKTRGGPDSLTTRGAFKMGNPNLRPPVRIGVGLMRPAEILFVGF